MHPHVDKKAEILYLWLDQSTLIVPEYVSRRALDLTSSNAVVGLETLCLSKRSSILKPFRLELEPVRVLVY